MSATPRPMDLIRSLVVGPKRIYVVKLVTDSGEVIAWTPDDPTAYIAVGPGETVEVILRRGGGQHVNAFAALLALARAFDEAATPEAVEIRHAFEEFDRAHPDWREWTA